MFKLITPPTVEPISLLEAKKHLRLIGNDDLTPVQSIAPGSYDITGETPFDGSPVDLSGYQGTIALDVGTCAGTLTVLIVHRNDPAEAWVEWESFSVVTSANDNQTFTLEYDGGKRYIMPRVTIETDSCNFGVSVVKQAPASPEDDVLMQKIKVAREVAEQHQERAYLTQTWKLRLKGWPRNNHGCLLDYIEIGKPPVQSITGITYKIKDGTVKTLETSKYFLDDGDEPPKAVLVPNQYWPTDELYPGHPIEIEFITGYETVDAFRNSIHELTVEWICRAGKWMMDNRDEPFDEEHFSRRALDLDRWRWF